MDSRPRMPQGMMRSKGARCWTLSAKPWEVTQRASPHANGANLCVFHPRAGGALDARPPSPRGRRPPDHDLLEVAHVVMHVAAFGGRSMIG